MFASLLRNSQLLKQIKSKPYIGRALSSSEAKGSQKYDLESLQFYDWEILARISLSEKCLLR